MTETGIIDDGAIGMEDNVKVSICGLGEGQRMESVSTPIDTPVEVLMMVIWISAYPFSHMPGWQRSTSLARPPTSV